MGREGQGIRPRRAGDGGVASGVWKGAGFAGTCDVRARPGPRKRRGPPGGCVPVGAASAASGGWKSGKSFFFFFLCVYMCKASGREVSRQEML